MNDTISDMLTRIRNALMVHKSDVVLPYSNFKHNLAKVLQAEGWIKTLDVSSGGKDLNSIKTLTLQLKYDSSGVSVITGIKRVSKPGQRIYSGRAEIPRVMGGMGTTIISTSRGLMTDKQARENKIGGEVVCQVW